MKTQKIIITEDHNLLFIIIINRDLHKVVKLQKIPQFSKTLGFVLKTSLEIMPFFTGPFEDFSAS